MGNVYLLTLSNFAFSNKLLIHVLLGSVSTVQHVSKRTPRPDTLASVPLGTAAVPVLTVGISTVPSPHTLPSPTTVFLFRVLLLLVYLKQEVHTVNNHSPVSVNNSFNILIKLVNKQRQKKVFYLVKTRLERRLLARASIVFCKPVNIQSMSSQSERAKMAIHWFGIY